MSVLQGAYSGKASNECGFDFQGLHGCGYLRFRNDVDIVTSCFKIFKVAILRLDIQCDSFSC
jgi:hypothetical protein